MTRQESSFQDNKLSNNLESMKKSLMNLEMENLCTSLIRGQTVLAAKVPSTAVQDKPARSLEFATAWLSMKKIFNRVKSKRIESVFYHNI